MSKPMFSLIDTILSFKRDKSLRNGRRTLRNPEFAITMSKEKVEDKYVITLTRTNYQNIVRIDTISMTISEKEENIWNMYNIYYIYSLNDITEGVFSSAEKVIYYLDNNMILDVYLDYGLDFIVDDIQFRNKSKTSFCGILQLFFDDIVIIGG